MHYWSFTWQPSLLGLLILAVIYFAPTITALALHSRNAGAVAGLNFFAGWTVVGWIVAWVVCFTGGRRTAQPALFVPGQPLAGELSDNGLFWWDGSAWRDTRIVAPPTAQRSIDGRWWWDGHTWRSVPTPPTS
jgi:hypothetical protein